MDGFVTTQLLYVAAKLGVAEALADGPRTGAEVAAAVGADAGAITRVLRGLALEDVVTEEDGRFALTPVGECLPAMAGALRVRGELYYHGARACSMRFGTAGRRSSASYGEPFFAHLDASPRRTRPRSRRRWRAARSRRRTPSSRRYDFGGFGRLVDVGGGRGVLLAAILQRRTRAAGRARRPPGARVDGGAARTSAARAECVAATSSRRCPPAPTPTCSRACCTTGTTPTRCASCAVCREAMAADARLLVVDAILPERAVDRPAAIRMDLHMLLLLGARERTEAEFRDAAGSAPGSSCGARPDRFAGGPRRHRGRT